MTTSTAIDVGGIVTALSSAVTPADVVTLIGTCVGAGIGFVLVWFGARKAIRAFQTALKNGKLSIG